MACSDGYYFIASGRYCALCPRGHFCTGGIKTVCADNTYSYEGAASCTITEKLEGFAGLAYPIPVNYGFHRDEGTNPYSIKQCPVDHYCPSPLHDEIACPTGWTSPAGHWTCIPYHPTAANGPILFSNNNAFTSLINYEKGGDYHFPCPYGTYNAPGVDQCIKVPANQEMDITDGSLRNCDTGNGFYSPEGEASCRKVPAGFRLSGGAVTPCPANTYSESGATSCSTCPSGTYSEGGYYTCIPCPAGYSCDTSG